MADQIDYNAITWPVQFTNEVHRSLYPFLDPNNPSLSATGKLVLIAGASGGIGRAVAKAWMIAGARGTVITGRKTSVLREVEEELRSMSQGPTKVIVLAADITNEEDVAKLWTKAKEELGSIHVLINNAGSLSQAGIGQREPLRWWQDFEVNVKGVYLNVHNLLAQAPQGKRTVISLSTGTLGDIYPDFSSYIPSRLAQTKFIEFLHAEQPGIHTLSVFPGLVATDMPPKQYLDYALDDSMLTGGLFLFLSTERAEWLRESMVSVNWAYEEMEAHKDEILEKGLTKLTFSNARFGKGGHPWGPP